MTDFPNFPVAQLKIIRKWISARSTIGKLYLNGKFFCYTLEDTLRPYGIKVKSETGIPAGLYDVLISKSARFKRDMPMIFTEDNGYEIKKEGISFKGVRIHGGNTHKNTDACVLVAYNKIDADTIQGSAERDLVKALKEYTEITLEIVNKQLKS